MGWNKLGQPTPAVGYCMVAQDLVPLDQVQVPARVMEDEPLDDPHV